MKISTSTQRLSACLSTLLIASIVGCSRPSECSLTLSPKSRGLLYQTVEDFRGHDGYLSFIEIERLKSITGTLNAVDTLSPRVVDYWKSIYDEVELHRPPVKVPTDWRFKIIDTEDIYAKVRVCGSEDPIYEGWINGQDLRRVEE